MCVRTKLGAHDGDTELLKGSTAANTSQEVCKHGLGGQILELECGIIQELFDPEEADVNEATTCVDGRSAEICYCNGAGIVLEHDKGSSDVDTEEFQ